MKLDFSLEKRLDLPNITIKLLEFDWPYDTAIEVETKNGYTITHSMKVFSPSDRPAWLLPTDPRPIAEHLLGLLPPGRPFRIIRPRGPNRLLTCRFDQKLFEANEMAEWSDELLSSLLSLNDKDVRSIFNMMTAEMANERPGRSQMLETLVDWLRIELVRFYKQETPVLRGANLLDWQMRKITKEFQNANNFRELDINILAESCRISKKYLMTKFKRTTGMTLYAYLELSRIERVKCLIAEDTLALREIAIEVGFGSSSHLTSSFKRLVGFTPSQYRAMCRA